MEVILKQPLKTSEIFKNAGFGIILTLLANLTIFSIGDSFGAFDKAINPIKNKPISLEDVIGDTLSYLAIGTILFLVLVRVRANPQRNFKILATGAGIFSMAQPFVMNDPEVIAVIFLESMHIFSTIIFIYFLSFRLK